MSQIWEYMDQRLNPEELPTMKELLSEIDENGGTDAALAGLREKQYRQYCCELIWRYPISQGDSAGGFLMPVREGILWIPYDEMEKDLNCMIYQLNGVLMQSRMKSFWYVKYTKAKNVIHFKIAIWKKTDSSQ